MNAKAFTLIELLVVVAIISILATISLPNFQHALIKARVAAAEKEMQTLSTAIEAYALDYNVYPLDGNDYFDKQEAYYDQLRIQSVLTTPTAYISEIPNDLFHEKNMHKEDLVANRNFQFGPPYPYIYSSHGNFMSNSGSPRAYYIFSIGPNYLFDNASEKEDNFVIYDITNGVISGGDILRKGP
ncbi:MAG: prepilin-type N-terminal cleavage/methylation domain-containing protein [bacterium]|jgi:prepilin-type N-terminal cleavage/methylation domain-containing protein|nr:prepilin-type N-terminal cleavage/methylation domain-containing protein [bacterium]